MTEIKPTINCFTESPRRWKGTGRRAETTLHEQTAPKDSTAERRYRSRKVTACRGKPRWYSGL